jgi:hypothetical protein
MSYGVTPQLRATLQKHGGDLNYHNCHPYGRGFKRAQGARGLSQFPVYFASPVDRDVSRPLVEPFRLAGCPYSPPRQPLFGFGKNMPSLSGRCWRRAVVRIMMKFEYPLVGVQRKSDFEVGWSVNGPGSDRRFARHHEC